MLTELEVHHIISAVKVSGSYDPDENMYQFEESLTFEQYDKIYDFLSWVHKTGTGFGWGNIQERYNQYLEAKENG